MTGIDSQHVQGRHGPVLHRGGGRYRLPGRAAGRVCRPVLRLAVAGSAPGRVVPGENVSTSWPKIRDSGSFCINILAADQKSICDAFARSGGDKFAELRMASRQHRIADSGR